RYGRDHRDRAHEAPGHPLAQRGVPELKAQGHSRCTIALEADGEVMKLTIRHEAETDGQQKLINAFADGWPFILSGLKSLLETGKALPRSDRLPE
ncbi:MAG: SRPBCC domain-containing protein, partial [Parvibaculaceae bacterium]